MTLTPQEYCDRSWDLVDEYVSGVTDNSIITGEYIKKVVKKYKTLVLAKDKYVYRVDKVDKVFKFFSFVKTELKNEYVQFPLLNWQAFILAYIFGFYFKDEPEKRVIREALLFIGRKNGKTNFSAALQLYGMLGDSVVKPQSILLANTSQQANVALSFAKDMVSHSKVLRDRLEGQRSRIIYKDRSKQGFCQTFSTVDSARLEGYSPSMCLMDEVHAWPDNTVYNAIKTGVGARLNPLMLIITTAGSNNAGFCTEYLNYHKNVLDEKIEDDNSVGFIYQIDSFDDLSDPKNWVKSNPSIGIINSLEDLKITFNQSKYSYADKHDFCTKHLNIFVDTPDVWIPQEDVSPCFKDIDIETFKGRDCYVGMDLSKTTDLTSISFLFPPIEEDPNICIYTIFFMADRQGNIIRKNGKDMTQWIKSGYITKCDSKVIDINQIYGKIIELSNKFNIVSISYDPYNSPELVSRLKEYGLYCAPFSQTATKFNAPLKIMETKIYEGNLKFIKNPCMLWQFGNVVLYVDGNANIKIVKNKQNDSVDGIVAAAMAVGGYIEGTFGQEVMGLNAYSNIINALS